MNPFTRRPAAEVEERAERWHYAVAAVIGAMGLAIIIAAHWRFAS